MSSEWRRLAEELPDDLPEALKGMEVQFKELAAHDPQRLPASAPTGAASRAELRAAFEEATQSFLKLKQAVESRKRELGARISELRRDEPRPVRGKFDRKG